MGRVIATTAALALAVLASFVRLPAAERYRETNGYEDVYYLPAPGWLSLLSLGHRDALADFIWMRTLVYYGDELGHQGSERHLFQYVEAVLTLDPDYVAVYRRVGTLAIYRAGEVSTEEVERAARIMERGAARFPDDGQLAWTTGATLAFELPPRYPGDPARQDAALARAAPYLVRATELGAAPPYATLLNASMLARVGHAEEAARHLEEMYAMTDDVEMRAEIASRIESLRSEAFATAFVTENQQFEDRWGHQMPYAPAALYDLVGPVPVVDTTATLRDGFAAHVFDDEPALD